MQAVAVAYRIWQAAHQHFGSNPVRNKARLAFTALIQGLKTLPPCFAFPSSDEGVWTVPTRRTKANRQHRVPLCGRAL